MALIITNLTLGRAYPPIVLWEPPSLNSVADEGCNIAASMIGPVRQLALQSLIRTQFVY